MPPIDLHARIQQVLSEPAPANWRPGQFGRELYLDLMETILQTAAAWQDPRGAIIDPVEGIEHHQTSCRFVAPGAILLSAGRAENLREKVLLGMDWCCARLANGQAGAGDFWMRELMTAWNSLANVPPARRAAWADDLRRVDPERVYTSVSPDGSRIHELHNFTVYASAGEAMRQVAGLGPQPDDPSIVWGSRFFEKYMPAQLDHFTELGMYRDPNDPLTYDMTTRLQIAAALAGGFQTPLRQPLDDLLRRGALTQLLYVSPAGFAPFGGRSNQMQLQEAILAALCEREAVRYKTSDPRLAGAFKRQARLCGASIRRWIDMAPLRHVKNAFPPADRHGCEPYAKWSVYSLFTASCLGLAWQFADETIPEAPTPAEIGGYLLELQPAFHKVFATCGQSHLEIDTAADPHYDATGLGRFHHAGLPPELGLSVPLAAHPAYHIPPQLLPAGDVAIGPGVRRADGVWQELAALHENLEAACTLERADAQAVHFTMRWRHAPTELVFLQHYQLTAGRLEIRASVTGPGRIDAIRFTVPLLLSDGAAATRIEMLDHGAAVHHPLGIYRVRFDAPAGENGIELQAPAANRNGIYRPLVFTRPGNALAVSLSLTPA